MIVTKLAKTKIIFAFICLFLWIPLYIIVRHMMVHSVTEQKSPSMHLPQSQFGDVPQVKVSVFYESLCPDSRYFVVDQLVPTFKKLPSLLKIDLVPYGKATTRVIGKDTYEFTCQHGEVECQGNIYHACVIKHVKNEKTALDIIQCMISNNIDPSGIAKQCTSDHNVSFEPISKCATSQEGKSLLKHYGERTISDLSPALSFVPTILLDGDRKNQAQILKDLFKEICAYYKLMSKAPRECDK